MKISSYGSNFKMPECRTVWHPVSPVLDWKKLTTSEHVWYWTKLTQSDIFLVWYRTKIWDAGMPMPVLVSSMPMPSYVLSFSFSDCLSCPYKVKVAQIWICFKCCSERNVLRKRIYCLFYFYFHILVSLEDSAKDWHLDPLWGDSCVHKLFPFYPADIATLYAHWVNTVSHLFDTHLSGGIEKIPLLYS